MGDRRKVLVWRHIFDVIFVVIFINDFRINYVTKSP